MGELRNLMAHNHLKLDFKCPEIQAQSDKLDGFIIKDRYGKIEDYGQKDRLIVARQKFILSTAMLANRLLIIGLGVKMF